MNTIIYVSIFVSACPLIQAPSIADILVCHIADKCLGISCCMTLDIKVKKLYVTAAIIVDPCEFVLSITFGNWLHNITLISFDWGMEKQQSIGNSVQIRYI